jgi:hypothetical protein
MTEELQTIPTVTPMTLLSMAVSQGADLDRIQKFMDLQERWEKNEAKKAFVQAMASFKTESIIIIKDKENPKFSTGNKKAMYTSLGNMVTIVTPFLSKHGLSVRWDISQEDRIKITAIITHQMGHSESCSFIGPPDVAGSKSPVQEIKSTITYGKAVTFESICGLASTDANMEDDGNGSSQKTISEDEFQLQLAQIKTAETIEILGEVYLKAYADAAVIDDRKTMSAYLQAKAKRQRDLKAEVKA